MTTRERLHQLVDEIPDDEAERLLRQLDSQEDEDETLAPELASLFDFMDEVAARAPREELNRMPTDLAENHDKYLYGTKP